MYLEKRYRNRFKIASKGRVLLVASFYCMHLVHAAPTGGVVSSGSAVIGTSGTATTIDQRSSKVIIEWQDFSIAENESVTFNQPDASSIALNRVIGTNKSVLEGVLSANGKVYLVNANGVLISKDATVNTAGFLASTLNITDENFKKGNFAFEADGTQGDVVNLGTIEVSEGAYVVLLGRQVSNEGAILATKGTVAMGSGDKITLNFNGNSLVDVTVDEGTLDALVETKQAIVADELLSAQVNIEGLVQAQTIGDLKGEIIAYADGGTVSVDGTLDASAPQRGDGGFIETSGDSVHVSDTAAITTKAADGTNGTWLIDPDGFTIGVGGDMTGDTLSAALENGSVTIESTDGSGEDGDIDVNDEVRWSENTLTLTATNSINVNNVMTATDSAGLNLNHGTGNDDNGVPYGVYMALGTDDFVGKINLDATTAVKINGVAYTVVTDLSGLLAIQGELDGHFILGSDIDASDYSGAIGSSGDPFTGSLNGFGHLITPYVNSSGLFGQIGEGALVSNIGITSALIIQETDVTDLGALADNSAGTIANAFVSGMVGSYSSRGVNIGGLVGTNSGLVVNSHATAEVYRGNRLGGLVGTNAETGVIIDSYAGAYITQDFSSSYNIYTGGLVGLNEGSIARSYTNSDSYIYQGTVTEYVYSGGLVGRNDSTAEISESYSETTTRGGLNSGGFVGINAGTITNAYSTGAIQTDNLNYTAGFVVKNTATGVIDASYSATALQAVTGSTTATYGFAGANAGTIGNSYWDTALVGTTTDASDSTAIGLDADEAGALASYSGFDSSVWGSSAEGHPILSNLPVTVLTSSTIEYGSDTAATLSGLTAIGLQWGDTVEQLFYTPQSGLLSASGYLNAGTYGAGDLLASSEYAAVLGSVTIVPKVLTISWVVADKVYDGTTDAILTSAAGGLEGLVGDETLQIAYSGAEFEDKSAGDAKTVLLTYTLADGANGGVTGNYTVATTTTASIDKKTITADYTVEDKVYDGTTAGSATVTGLNGVVSGDTVFVDSVAAAFADENAGEGIAVSVSGMLGGDDAGNYALASADEAADITPRVIVLSGTKSWDGTVAIGASDLRIENIVSGDSVTLSGSAFLGDAATGTQAIAGLGTLAVDNGNYTLAGATGSAVIFNSQKVGTVAEGDATITGSGDTTTIIQSTDKVVIDWSLFNVAPTETVIYVQPETTSIALNRILSGEQTIIAGTVTANGIVYFINTDGILFTPTAVINTAGFLASTLALSNNDFLNGLYAFSGSGSEVKNQGTIRVDDDGYIVFIGAEVSTDGSLTAEGGDAALISAEDVTLAFGGNGGSLESVTLDETGGSVSVGGVVDLASDARQGGTLQTFADAFSVAGDLQLRTGGSDGDGYWMMATGGDFVVGSTLSGDALSQSLADADVMLRSLTGEVAVNDDVSWSANTLALYAETNINVNAVMSAEGTAGFTGIYGEGDNDDGTAYGLYTAMTPDDAGTFTGKINFDGTGTVILGTADEAYEYTVIHNAEELDALRDDIVVYWEAEPGESAYDTYTQTERPCAGANTATCTLSVTAGGHYILGNDIDLSAFTDWEPLDIIVTSEGHGLLPTALDAGVLNGFGHVVSNLTSTRGGLFGKVMGTISNLGVADYTIVSASGTSSDDVGGFVNTLTGTIANAFATGTIYGNGSGFVGSIYQNGSLANSYSVIDIYGAGAGFAGDNFGTITGSHAVGTITGGGGGFAGQNRGADASITDSYADVDIIMTGISGSAGGFVVTNEGYIARSYATGNITGYTVQGYSGDTMLNFGAVGGFVAVNTGFSALIEDSYATGDIDVQGINGTQAIDHVGGFVGMQGDQMAGVSGATIINSYATGDVSSNGDYVGGFAGVNQYNNVIANSYSTGNVYGRDYVGGFVGQNGSYILSLLLELGGSGLWNFQSVEEHIAFHFGLDAIDAISGAQISDSWSSGTVTAEGEHSGAFAAVNKAGGQISDSYVTGDGMSSGAFVGENGVGDDWAIKHFGTEQGTSVIENSGFGTPEERARWAAEAEAEVETQSSRAEATQRLQALESAALKQTGTPADLSAFSYAFFENQAPTSLEENIDIVDRSYSTDIKTITIDGITYTLDEDDE